MAHKYPHSVIQTGYKIEFSPQILKKMNHKIFNRCQNVYLSRLYALDKSSDDFMTSLQIDETKICDINQLLVLRFSANILSKNEHLNTFGAEHKRELFYSLSIKNRIKYLFTNWLKSRIRTGYKNLLLIKRYI